MVLWLKSYYTINVKVKWSRSVLNEVYFKCLKVRGWCDINKKEIEFEFEWTTKNMYWLQEKVSGVLSRGTLHVKKSAAQIGS